MPKNTKEQKELKNDKKEVATSKKASTARKTTTSKTTKKTPSTPKADTVKKAKVSTSKTGAKKTTTKKASSSKSTSTTKKKTTTSKKVSAAKKPKTAKKTTTKKATTKKTSVKKPEVLEYYDLPYRYNQTVIKVLAQTPTTLFIYWDISDEDRENYKKQYGENFFDITKPVLIVYNDTLGYNFEVEINDFANSWYLHVADSKCDYRVELGRRPITNNDKLNTDYIFISDSNEIESPNDKILFNKQQKMIYFRNTKTNKETHKSINNISFLTNMGKIYDIYDLYKLIYKNENVEEIYNTSNPSSGNPSSHF